MKFVSVSLLTAVGLALSACAHTPAAPDTAIQAITLEQGPCFGFCPIYAVTLNANLSYTFNPTDFTRSEKPDAGRLTPTQWKLATEAVEEADFFSIPSDYSPSNPNVCPNAPTDAPSASITVTLQDNTSHTVGYYYGCGNEAFETLVMRLQGSFDFNRLVGGNK